MGVWVDRSESGCAVQAAISQSIGRRTRLQPSCNVSCRRGLRWDIFEQSLRWRGGRRLDLQSGVLSRTRVASPVSETARVSSFKGDQGQPERGGAHLCVDQRRWRRLLFGDTGIATWEAGAVREAAAVVRSVPPRSPPGGVVTSWCLVVYALLYRISPEDDHMR